MRELRIRELTTPERWPALALQNVSSSIRFAAGLSGFFSFSQRLSGRHTP